MKSFNTFVAAVVLGVSASAAQAGFTNLAEWTFETSLPTTAGPHAAEGGLYGGSATGFHTLSATAYSNPVGNGSNESFSSNNWSSGDYYQFQTSTVGYESIEVTWDQVRSGTGPGNFRLQWSTDGSTFFDIVDFAVLSGSFSSGSYNATFTFAPVALPAGADNQASVYVRMMSLETTASAGTNRIDNILINGTTIPAPGALALLGVAGLVGTRRRRS